MRTICWVALGCLVLTLPSAPADEPTDLKPLVDKVLNAHGGEKKVAGVKAFVEKTKTTSPDGKFTTWDRYVQLPDQMRQESEFELAGKRVKCVLVFAGDNGWKKIDDEPAQAYRAAFKGKKDPLKYAGPRAWLRLLDPAYKLTALGESKVGDRPAFGILFSFGKDPAEKLFFDKATGLLLKEEKTLLYPSTGKIEFYETFYDDYQATAGIPVARKIIKKRDGKTIQQIEVTEFSIVEKLDAKLFEKP